MLLGLQISALSDEKRRWGQGPAGGSSLWWTVNKPLDNCKCAEKSMLPKPERVWPHCFFPDGYQKGTVLKKKKRQSPVHRAGAAPFLALLWTVQASQNLTEFRMLAIGLVGLHTGEPGCLEGYHVHIWRGTLGDCHCILPCSGSGVRVISPPPQHTQGFLFWNKS